MTSSPPALALVLIGYGKMGQIIEKIAQERGHHIAAVVQKTDTPEVAAQKIRLGQVAIEFTTPEAAAQNAYLCLQNRLPLVSGTTGWLDAKAAFERDCLAEGGSFFWASNFSIGVHLFFKMSRLMSQLAAPQAYQPHITEIHHTQKKDAPSGTAITLAEQVLPHFQKLQQWTLNQGQDLAPATLPIEALREEGVVGTHTLFLEGEYDQISLTHKAHSRQGFALGAVVAAEFLYGKKGVFGMDDLIP
ncbi:4-hydroxy-tetrahydrodipicolinate reductase [Hugenholtzia roseola]|uniref:4-hydroxy-tetrahydrodipicolinate reductase n=1 Tax=Hugenholtzia roseola TaxID=1002 RepID=UPI000418353F|nr:4-hydroxy-tetrahydrodipicolinate reductase [Hugenholtzia roseola]